MDAEVSAATQSTRATMSHAASVSVPQSGNVVQDELLAAELPGTPPEGIRFISDGGKCYTGEPISKSDVAGMEVTRRVEGGKD